MKSAAIHHFPQIIIENHQKWLYNPILKKRFKNRPEERVRLQWVEYLLWETACKKSRIGFETPVNVSQSDNTLRADLILYTGDFKPEVLIECKSERVKLNETAALQAARYNSSLNADYIVLTNGVEDFIFRQNNGMSPVDELPYKNTTKRFSLDLDYWSKRGCCPAAASSDLADWLPKALNAFWSAEHNFTKRYISFTDSMISLPMENYYRLFKTGSGTTLAISFIGNKTSEAYLVGVLNRDGNNSGVVVVNLTRMAEDKEDSACCYRQGECELVKAKNILPLPFKDFDPGDIKKLPGNMMKFFE